MPPKSRKAHGLPYACTEEGCSYLNYRYEVRMHYVAKHMSLSKVPYYCLQCGERFRTKAMADAHRNNRHEGQRFKELFEGTYGDLTDADFPSEQRLTEEEAARRRAAEETSSEPKGADRTAELKRLMSPRNHNQGSPPRKQPKLSEASQPEATPTTQQSDEKQRQLKPAEANIKVVSEPEPTKVLCSQSKQEVKHEDGQEAGEEEADAHSVLGSVSSGEEEEEEESSGDSEEEEVPQGEWRIVRCDDQGKDSDRREEEAALDGDNSSQPTEKPQKECSGILAGGSNEGAEVSAEETSTKNHVKPAAQEPEIEVHAASHSIDPPTADAVDRLTTVLKDVVKTQQTWANQQAEIVSLMRRMTEVMERNPGAPPLLPSLQPVGHSSSNRSGSCLDSSSHHHQSSSHSHHTQSGRSSSSSKSADDRRKTSNDKKSDHRRSSHKDRSHRP